MSDVTQARLPNWANVPTVEDLKQDYQLATNNHNNMVTKIDGYLDNLHIKGKAKIPKATGRSSVQPQLIRKQAEWRYSALSEPFLSSDNIFQVDPITFEDKDSAVENQLVLNYQFNTQMNKVSFIDNYVRNCVNEGTVIVRVGWSFKESKHKETVNTYEYVQCPEDKLPQVMDAIQIKLTSENEFNRLPEHIRLSVDATAENATPVWANKTGSTEIEVSEVIENKPEITICDYRDIYVDPLCRGNLSKANFIIFKFETSIDELKKTGLYFNLDDIKLAEASPLSLPDSSYKEDMLSSENFTDKPRQKIIACEYWGYKDINNDGTLHPIVATWVGNTLIRMEINPYPDKKLPFVFVPYLPIKDSLYGEPDGALLQENQSIVGAITRGMVDLMARSANGQKGIRKDALDVLNRKRFMEGRDYEINSNIADPASIVFTHTYPDIPQSAGLLIDYFNNEAESLTGVKAFNGGISADSLGQVASGVRSVLDAASKREMAILRRLSAGLVEIGYKILALNSEFLSEQEVIRITNEEFKTIRRDSLKGRYDISLTISTAEADDAKAQELAFMLQTMGNTLPPPVTQIMLSEIARLRKMPDISQQIKMYKPEPNPFDQEMQQLALQNSILKNKLLEAQIQATLSGANLDFSKAKLAESQVGLVNSQVDQNNLDYLEQESGVDHARKVDVVQSQAKAQAQLAVLQNVLNTHPKTQA